MLEDNPDPHFYWNWGVQIATAAATFLAVLAALFLDWFRAKFFPPVLRLRLVNMRGAPPTPIYVVTQGNPVAYTSVSRWYHVEVTNDRRMSPAKDTQVCLLAFSIPNAAGDYVETQIGAIPLKVRNEGVVTPGRIIGPTLEFDLCSVIRDTAPGGRPAVEFQTVAILTAMTSRHLQPFKTVLKLQARSIEADSNLLHVEIIWDGQWADDTQVMANHLVIKYWE
jgi:hypothetical protein